MDAHEYRLKERQVNLLNDVASSVDDLRSDLNHNSEVNCKSCSYNILVASLSSSGYVPQG